LTGIAGEGRYGFTRCWFGRRIGTKLALGTELPGKRKPQA